MTGERSNGIESEITTERLSRSSVFTLLDNDRRRYALFHLLASDGDGPLTIGSMAERIAAWENEISVGEVTSRERKLVYNSLQQSHLPKLAEFGVVEYDADRGTVELTEQGRVLEEFLYAGLADEQVWKYVYFGIGTFGLVLGLVLSLEVQIVTFITPLEWLVLISVILCVCSILHAYREYLRIREIEEPPSLKTERTDDPREISHSVENNEARNV